MAKSKKNLGRILFSFRFKTELKNQLEKIAEEEDRSLAYIINKAIEEWLEVRKSK